MNDTKKILLITICIMSFAVAAQWGLNLAISILGVEASTSHVDYKNVREKRLFKAVRSDDAVKISKMLGRHRSDVDATYDRHACFSARLGISLLHVAIGKPKIVKLLLEFDADPNKADWVGKTPLMDAAESGQIKTMEILLAHGAGTDFKEKFSGLTAEDYLKRYIGRYQWNTDGKGFHEIQGMLTRLSVVKEEE